MALNLITGPWIPVRMKDGSARMVTPDGVSDGQVAALDWPRADLNLACMELLIGLVLMADPPVDLKDWSARQAPDSSRLSQRLLYYAPAFELLGGGARFMQDRVELEGAGDGVSMLFIDSAGTSTAKKNADLMPHRGRYDALQHGLAAMALYTLQAFAPSGGAGNRTSMRGGGPMVTLVDPGQGLWSLIWANVPYGTPATMDDLPWMRATRTSQKGEVVSYEDAHPVEAFFGMPRRLRLIGDERGIVGVRQRPYGTNYAGWVHPCAPYYQQKVGSEHLPVHPKPGLFGYRNWLGIAYQDSGGLRHPAQMVMEWFAHRLHHVEDEATLLVAGWAMANMSAQDFIWSRAPLVALDLDGLDRLSGLVKAAQTYSSALRRALEPVLEGEAREAEVEAFFAETQAPFDGLLPRLAEGEDVAQDWLTEMRRVALELFDRRALPLLHVHKLEKKAEIVARRGQLAAAFKGYGKYGEGAYRVLEMMPPPRKKGKAA